MPAAAENAPDPAVSESRVFLDLSTTMQGYLSQGDTEIPVTLLQHLLQNLLTQAFRSAGLAPAEAFGFGREVRPLAKELTFYGIPQGEGTAATRGLYDASETDLVAAFDQVARERSAVSVVVTDGLQDLLTPKSDRARGYDREAIVESVAGFLHEELGFGVWLVGVLDEFEGAYYTVQPVKIESGVRTNHRYWVRPSKRPFYCWIFSRDLAKGREVTSYLTRELARIAAPGEGGEPRVRAVELAPGLVPEVRLIEPGLDELRDPRLDEPEPEGQGHSSRLRPRSYFSVRSWEQSPTNPQQARSCLGFERGLGGELHFLLKARLGLDNAQATWEDFPLDLWRFELARRGSAPAFSEAVEVGAFSYSGRPAEIPLGLRVSSQNLLSRPEAERVLPLAFELRIDLEGALADHWLGRWSTDDDTTPEAFNGRTLYLADLSRGILQRTLGRPKPGGCLELTMVQR